MARGVRHFVAAAARARRRSATPRSTAASIRLAPIHSDGYSYYVYLPSVFIYHDVTLETLANDWYGGPLSGLHRHSPMAVDRSLAEPASRSAPRS